MSNMVILGSQWGDEGKGKFVDIFTDSFDVVVRYQGGHNAGHTVIIGDAKYVLHLIPSGILRPGKLCVIGNGLVVDPVALVAEIDLLRGQGVEVDGRLYISDRAHLILPFHRVIEKIDETARAGQAIGTTLRGIGPAYGDKYFRCGVRAGALRDDARLRRECAEYQALKARLMGAELRPAEPAAEWTAFFAACARLSGYVADTSALLEECLAADRRVLFEGAQGTMLDVDHGTYPFVTSSSAVAAGAAAGAGVPPHRLGQIVGVMKAYTTRVGAGPFPTELLDGTGAELRHRGGEYGASTGRPRRCGWLDLFQMRYAHRVNGFHSLLMTKLDVLDALTEIRVCIGYNLDGEPLDSVPYAVEDLQRVEPVWHVMPGWSSRTAGMNRFEDLPPKARAYLDFIQDYLGVEIGMVSTGPERGETMIMPGAAEIVTALGRPSL